MWVYLRDVIEENRFHNFVRESEKALLVLSSAGHERGNLMSNTVNKTHISFNDFIHSCLDIISLRIVRREERKLYSLAKLQ